MGRLWGPENRSKRKRGECFACRQGETHRQKQEHGRGRAVQQKTSGNCIIFFLLSSFVCLYARAVERSRWNLGWNSGGIVPSNNRARSRRLSMQIWGTSVEGSFFSLLDLLFHLSFFVPCHFLFSCPFPSLPFPYFEGGFCSDVRSVYFSRSSGDGWEGTMSLLSS